MGIVTEVGAEVTGWEDSRFQVSCFNPSLPCRHEIVGIVTEVGTEVTGWEVGTRAGIGCFVRACRDCKQCHKSVDQYCRKMVCAYAAHLPVLSQHRDEDGMQMRIAEQPRHHITSTLHCTATSVQHQFGSNITAKSAMSVALEALLHHTLALVDQERVLRQVFTYNAQDWGEDNSCDAGRVQRLLRHRPPVRGLRAPKP